MAAISLSSHDFFVHIRGEGGAKFSGSFLVASSIPSWSPTLRTSSTSIHLPTASFLNFLMLEVKGSTYTLGGDTNVQLII